MIRTLLSKGANLQCAIRIDTPIGLLLSSLLMLVASGIILCAQSVGTIKGVVRDAKTLSPLAAATVSLRDLADSNAPLLGDICDREGAFRIEGVRSGRDYQLKVRYVGYRTDSGRVVRVQQGASELDLGSIALGVDSTNLNAVVVEEKRPDVIVMADKTVYAVEQAGTYTATNVSELLGQLPSVFVDPDGNISLRGDNSVQIMMNGRVLNMPTEQRNKFLQSLPASIVKDIEIRTTPGVQFDAKATGGIINIISRRTMSDMFGGVVNAGANTRNAYDAGLNTYYNDAGLNASLGGSVGVGQNAGSGSSSRINFLDTLVRRDVGSNTNESTSDQYSLYGQMDYELDSHNVVSASFNRSQWSYAWSSKGSRSFYDPKDNLLYSFNDRTTPGNNGGSTGSSTGASILYKHLFTDEHKLTFDVAYDGYNHANGNDYTGDYTLPTGLIDSLRSIHRISANSEPDNEINIKLDYANPIDDLFTMSVGAKSELSWTEKRSSVTNLDVLTRQNVIDSSLSYHYRQNESTYAMYGNASYRPWKDLGLQFGIRVENADISAKRTDGTVMVDKSYVNIFPGASASLTISEASSLTFSYRRSVRLPDVDDLNPVRARWGQFWESVGNPNVLPEIYNSFNLNYAYMWGQGNMCSVSPSYTATSNSIERTETIKDGLTTSTTVNFVGEHRFGTSISVRLHPLEWLNFDVSTDVFSSINRGGTASGDIYSSGTGYSANGSIRIAFTKDLSFNMNAYVWQPAVIGSVQNSSNVYVSTTIRQELFEKALSITLRVNDPFNQQNWKRSFVTPQFKTESFSEWSSRFASLNVTYTFGTTPRMEDHDTRDGGGGGGSGGGGGGGM